MATENTVAVRINILADHSETYDVVISDGDDNVIYLFPEDKKACDVLVASLTASGVTDKGAFRNVCY